MRETNETPMQVQIEVGTKNSGIKTNNVLMQYFLQLEVNAKKSMAKKRPKF